MSKAQLVRQKTAALVTAGNKAQSAAAKRATELLEEIARRKERIAEEFYDIGEALREIQKRKLFAALGYPTFKAMLHARKVMSSAQAYKLIGIVTSLPRDKALTAGSEKAWLLAGYADATAEADTPERLLDEGRLPSGKPIAEASTRELADAVKKARATTRKKARSPEEVQAHASARATQAALRRRGAKETTATAVKRGGKWWLRVEVPVVSAKLFDG